VRLAAGVLVVGVAATGLHDEPEGDWPRYCAYAGVVSFVLAAVGLALGAF